jgi:hypothetical protein
LDEVDSGVDADICSFTYISILYANIRSKIGSACTREHRP